MEILKAIFISMLSFFLIIGCVKDIDSQRLVDSKEVIETDNENLQVKPDNRLIKHESLVNEKLRVSKEPLVSKEQARKEQLMYLSSIQSKQMGQRRKLVAERELAIYPASKNEHYQKSLSNAVKQTITTPLSTFSIDVDTGSYANVRSMIQMGVLPSSDAIREEAFINYFDYQYPQAIDRNNPIKVSAEVAPSPWNNKRQLVNIALAGFDIPKSERKPSNLVFLIDVSGSMSERNKLPLLTQSLSMMVNELSERDTVSLVTYAGATEVILAPTKGNDKDTIIQALKSLSSAGGTNGESGIKLAYSQAKKAFISGGVNRVILATDGDFNVGLTDIETLKKLVEQERKSGIALTTLGVGRGNYNDALMEQLADIGDGNHAYIDTLQEANKVLVRQMSATLQTIAKDVKIQVEFNPANVKEYRLIGYQNRLLADEDFRNDQVDAGEIGVGHKVTALYEVTLTEHVGQIDDLKYKAEPSMVSVHSDELMSIKVRYKLPESSTSQQEVKNIMMGSIVNEFSQASSDFQFSAAVASFAQKMKHDKYTASISFEQIADIARKNRGADPFNYRGEFVNLVSLVQAM